MENINHQITIKASAKNIYDLISTKEGVQKLVDQPEGRGIMPHYEIWPTLEDFGTHRDTQMEFIFDLINN